MTKSVRKASWTKGIERRSGSMPAPIEATSQATTTSKTAIASRDGPYPSACRGRRAAHSAARLAISTGSQKAAITSSS